VTDIENLEKQIEHQNNLEGQMTEEERLSPLNIVNRQNVNFETTIGAVAIAIEKFGEHSERKHERESEKMKLEHTQDSAKLEQSYARFTKGYWLLVGVIIFLVSLVIGLIFVKDDTDTAIKILTHVLAVGMGVITGVGWKNKPK
jgi:hypothetical protein